MIKRITLQIWLTFSFTTHQSNTIHCFFSNICPRKFSKCGTPSAKGTKYQSCILCLIPVLVSTELTFLCFLCHYFFFLFTVLFLLPHISIRHLWEQRRNTHNKNILKMCLSRRCRHGFSRVWLDILLPSWPCLLPKEAFTFEVNGKHIFFCGRGDQKEERGCVVNMEMALWAKNGNKYETIVYGNILLGKFIVS